MDTILTLVNKGNDFLWSFLLLILLCGTGIYYTIRLKFIQVRKFGEGCKHVFGHFSLNGEKHEKGEMSPFQSIMTAIAAQVGTGNLAGAATALFGGGPGAIFWMWLSAFFGMATIYSEAVLAQTYKTEVNGEVTGGPVYYIKAAFKGNFGKVLSTLFAIFIVLALGFMGNMVQSNSIGAAFNNAFHVPKLAVGICVAVIAGIIFIGGIKRIANVSQVVVPFMALLYVVFAVLLLLCNVTKIPNAIVQIVQGAFGYGDGIQGIRAAAGGVLGAMMAAMQNGVAKGIFSNEAGLGSAPIAAAAAKTKDTVRQGLVSMTGTFIDTIVICTMTGLAIVIAGSWANPDLKGVAITTVAFQSGLPFPSVVSSFVLMICLAFFAFTTILGWDYYSERCLEYLSNRNKTVVKVYRWIYVLAVFIGPYLTVAAVWTIADIFNGLMAIPNVIALIALSGVVAKETRDYFKEFDRLSK